jgi:excisionase family DNA binding protein
VFAEDVAVHVGVAKDTVYRWLDERTLPAHRVGRLWKFKLSDVDEWVRAGTPAMPSRSPSQSTAERRRDEPPSPDTNGT